MYSTIVHIVIDFFFCCFLLCWDVASMKPSVAYDRLLSPQMIEKQSIIAPCPRSWMMRA